MPTFWKTSLPWKPKKNTKRNVTKEQKQEVFERDGYRCIICGSWNLEATPHHAWHGIEANYWPDRNDPSQLVTICIDCHRDIHAKWDNEKREFCKTYLLK